MTDARLFSPAAARNVVPLGDALEALLPLSGTVLEIASGSGQHAVALATRFPRLRWQPTDRDAAARASIDAYRRECDVPNVAAALALDVTSLEWWRDVETPSAILAVNLIHISPWEATTGLFQGARALLPPGAPVVLYGPFFENGATPAPSNLDFDRSLRDRDPRWGVRALDAVVAVAAGHGFAEAARVAMPANNLTVAFRRQSTGDNSRASRTASRNG